MTCPHQSRIRDRGQFDCALGYYGGKPWLGNCIECMKRGNNTPEAKAAFDASADKANPTNIKRISGCCDNKSYPSLTSMGGNFVSALAREAKSLVVGEKAIDKDVFNQRITTCQSCEHFVVDSSRCLKCGCFIKIKARMRSQKCPIGKW